MKVELIKWHYLPGQDFKDQVYQELTSGTSPILVQDFLGNDQEYRTFVDGISRTIYSDQLTDANDLFEVKVTYSATDFFSVATSNYAFPLHTDLSDEAVCPNAMALLCIQPSDTGGETTITPLRSMLDSMPERLKHLLLTHPFSFRNLRKPILEFTDGAYQIRYSRIMIESYSEPLTAAEAEMLNQLDEIIRQHSYMLSLKKGDLLLLRNDLFLHGRWAFPSTSDRLLKRIRFYV